MCSDTSKSSRHPELKPYIIEDLTKSDITITLGGTEYTYRRWRGSLAVNQGWPKGVHGEAATSGSVYKVVYPVRAEFPIVYNAALFDIQLLKRNGLLVPFISWTALASKDPSQHLRYVLAYSGITMCTSHPKIM